MRALLDTHVFLWMQTEPERIGPALDRLAAPETELLVSAVSSWEIAIKHAMGRLPIPEPPEVYVPAAVRAIGAQPVAVEHEHALGVAALEPLHRDPFDRLLVAQAIAFGATLVTADQQVAQYPADTLLV